MKKTSIKKHNTGSRISKLLSAVLISLILLAALPVSIPAQAATIITYKVEVTSESKASGWNNARLELHYKDRSGNTSSDSWDIKNDISNGNNVTKIVPRYETDKVPYMIRLYLDFGGGFTIRSHSGRVKFSVEGEEIMNEAYSARSYPFSSSNETLDFAIYGLVPAEVIAADGSSKSYATVKQAWNEAKDLEGSTVKLSRNATVKGTLEVKKNIKIDLNGCLLANAEVSPLFHVMSGGKLSIIDSDPNRDTGETFFCTTGMTSEEEAESRTYPLKGGGIYHGGSEESGGAVKVDEGGKLNVEGCTFTDCHSSENGGAIHCEGSMTLEGTKFISCTSEENGGAISCKGKPAITFNDLTFEKCESDIGGAFCVYDVKTSTNIGTMSDCTFKECKARSTGGGLRLSTKAEILTDNLTFNNCRSEVGGGVYSSSSCPVTFNDAVFNNCTAENGGGFAYKSGGKTTLNHVEFNNCSSAKCGGGLYLIPIFPYRQYTHSEDFKLDSCRIHDCTANNEGGGIYVYDDDESDSKLNRVLIYKTNIENNTAEKGGGIYVESKFVYLIDSSVTNNQAAGKYGGGVYVDSMDDIEVAETVVIRDNTANGEKNNLCLQNGTFSSAKLYSGGLYDGSYIGISSTSNSAVTVGKNMSQYQVGKYLYADDAGRRFSMTNTREEDTPLFASIVSENVSLIIVICGVVAIAVVIGLLFFRKRRKEGKKDDEANAEQSDANDDEENE